MSAGPVRVLVLSGSERAGSLNRRLANAAAQLVRSDGGVANVLDLRALDLPVYDGDIQAAGFPAGTATLRDAFADSNAVLIASPEYNGFPTPLLINAFDWLSRVPATEQQASGLAVLGGKVAGLLSASPGPLGGLRSLITLRQFLQLSLGFLVVPEQFALGQAGDAFDAEGGLREDKQKQGVQRVVSSVLATAAALKHRAV